MKLFLVLVAVVVFVLGGLLGGLYYRYVTNTVSPYDEIGITLNNWMPGPINAWGCGRLKETFSTALPPFGCAAEGNPRIWRD